MNQRNMVWATKFMGVLWAIWKQRNEYIFRNKRMAPWLLARKIHEVWMSCYRGRNRMHICVFVFLVVLIFFYFFRVFSFDRLNYDVVNKFTFLYQERLPRSRRTFLVDASTITSWKKLAGNLYPQQHACWLLLRLCVDSPVRMALPLLRSSPLVILDWTCPSMTAKMEIASHIGLPE